MKEGGSLPGEGGMDKRSCLVAKGGLKLTCDEERVPGNVLSQREPGKSFIMLSPFFKV